MHSEYYIDTGGGKDGPHDVIALMRRIRSKKILPDTLIYIESNPHPVRAAAVPELAIFFQRQAAAPQQKAAPSLGKLLVRGWEFVVENNVMTVYAGGLLLLAFMLAWGLIGAFGWIMGGMLTWMASVLMTSLYLIFALRLYRGQLFSSAFLKQQLLPVLPMLILSSAILALMMAGGLLLFVVPCVLVAILYIFVPFLILDHRFDAIEAMHASRMLLRKSGRRSLNIVYELVLLHFVCLALIIPIPLTLPIFAAALAELYEELSSS